MKARKTEKIPKPKLNVVSFWPTSVPKIIAGGDAESQLRVTPSDIVDALKAAHEISPLEDHAAAIAQIENMVKRRAYGAAMMMLWNVSSTWAFKHGSFTGTNGRALEKEEQKATSAKNGAKSGDAEKYRNEARIHTRDRLKAGEDWGDIVTDLAVKYKKSESAIKKWLGGLCPHRRGPRPKN